MLLLLSMLNVGVLDVNDKSNSWILTCNLMFDGLGLLKCENVSTSSCQHVCIYPFNLCTITLHWCFGWYDNNINI